MFHIAAMWPEVERLANEGLCAIAVTAAYPYVAPGGGTKPLFGTNPMGFAWPRKDKPPLVFDQASSAMVVLQGAQLGFGGYKGASLAMMIELLAGPLIGEFLSFESQNDDAGRGGPPKGGELIIAIDPSKFGDLDSVLAHGEKLFAEILKQEGTRLPGQRRFQMRETTPNTGFTIPKSLYDDIMALMNP